MLAEAPQVDLHALSRFVLGSRGSFAEALIAYMSICERRPSKFKGWGGVLASGVPLCHRARG